MAGNTVFTDAHEILEYFRPEDFYFRITQPREAKSNKKSERNAIPAYAPPTCCGCFIMAAYAPSAAVTPQGLCSGVTYACHAYSPQSHAHPTAHGSAPRHICKKIKKKQDSRARFLRQPVLYGEYSKQDKTNNNSKERISK